MLEASIRDPALHAINDAHGLAKLLGRADEQIGPLKESGVGREAVIVGLELDRGFELVDPAAGLDVAV